MKKLWKAIKKIWHDSVWSRVIAAAIVASASYLFGWVQWIWRFFLSWIGTVRSIYELNPYEITTWVLGLLLLIVIILVFFRKRKPKEDVKPVGIKWIRLLALGQLSRFGFLFWFTLNKRLKTHLYDERRSFTWGQISFDHIPEIRELMDHRVLWFTSEGLGQYSLEIDQDVYSYLHQIYEQEKTLMDEKTRSVFETYTTVPFDALFPNARQF